VSAYTTLRARLSACPYPTVAVDLAAMAVAGLLFFASGVAFVALIAAALISTFMAFFSPAPGFMFAAWAWAALCVAGYNVVRSMELINAPDWRALGWVGVRSALVTLACPVWWLLPFGEAF